MNFISKLALLALLSTNALAAPAPESRRRAGRKCRGRGHCRAAEQAQVSTVQAVYLMTNDPADNAIIPISVAADGSLSAASDPISTGGKGSAGIVAATGNASGPDALFSQDAIRVGDNFLFAVNAGSNTLSMFNIDTSDPTKLSLVGNPVDTQGEFPVAVAYSSTLQQACVVNGGAVSNMACYSVCASSGLSPVSGFTVSSFGLNQTTPPQGPPSTVSDIFFAPGSKSLHVTVKGPNFGDGALLSFPCDAAAGVCDTATASTPDGTAVLFGSVFINDNTFLATDASFGATTIQIDENDLAKPKVLSTTPIEGQGASCWSAFSKTTKTSFVMDVLVNHIVEVDANGGIASAVNLTNGNPGMTDAQVGGDFLYALSPLNDSVAVAVMDLSGGAGKQKEKQTFTVQGAGKLSVGLQVFPAVSF